MAVLHGLYHGDVQAADAKLGRVLAALEQLRAERPVVLVVTSDHGERFGEHGLVAHRAGVDNVLLHVPLIVNGLPDVPAARIAIPVQLADLLPSILKWAGQPRPKGLPGRPLPLTPSRHPKPRPLIAQFHDAVPRLLQEPPEVVPEAVKDALARSVAACGDRPRATGDMQTVIQYPFKLDLFARLDPQLFDLRDDPAEERDLAHRRPRTVQTLRASLDRIVQSAVIPPHRTRIDLDPATVAELQTLGYLEKWGEASETR